MNTNLIPDNMELLLIFLDVIMVLQSYENNLMFKMYAGISKGKSHDVCKLLSNSTAKYILVYMCFYKANVAKC